MLRVRCSNARVPNSEVVYRKLQHRKFTLRKQTEKIFRDLRETSVDDPVALERVSLELYDSTRALNRVHRTIHRFDQLAWFYDYTEDSELEL